MLHAPAFAQSAWENPAKVSKAWTKTIHGANTPPEQKPKRQLTSAHTPARLPCPGSSPEIPFGFRLGNRQSLFKALEPRTIVIPGSCSIVRLVCDFIEILI